MTALACGRSEAPGAADDSGVRACLGDAGTPTLAHVKTWEPGCIEVVYDSALAAELPMLRAALAAWSRPSCTSLCFKPPRPSVFGEPPSKGIILMWDAGAMRPTDPDLVTFYSASPGGLEFAWLNRRKRTNSSAAAYLTAVGAAIGFERTPGVTSVLNGELPDLTTADLESVCALYPCR